MTGAPTLRAWLASREPVAPPKLVERLEAIIGDDAMNGSAGAEILLERGISTLRSALSDRDGALDLLAADALITYAMEAAAEHCSTMDQTAAEAIERIARGTA
ncbi:MAG: hypothetical protein ACRD3J_20160 [Thermoanaerobaculia bacterium]